MQTSASCRRDALRLAQGFTLLELLVVMAVVGLLAGLIAPNLEKLLGSVDRATRRDGLAADIAGLSYRAYTLGEAFELKDDGLSRLMKDGNPILVVPAGWRVLVQPPIRFGFNGVCSGGVVTLVAPDGFREPLRLRAPDCQIER